MSQQPNLFSRMYSNDHLTKVDLSKTFHLNLSEPLKQYLAQVFSILTLGVVVACIGVYSHLRYNFSLGMAAWLAQIGLLVYLGMSSNKDASPLRLGAMGAFCFVNGLQFGPIIQRSLAIDPTIVITALLLTATAFACFAYFAIRRDTSAGLFGASFLSTALSGLCLLSLMAWIFPSLRGVYYFASLYGGLLVFCGYVVYDTQVIIQDFAEGRKDPVQHAIGLFLDFAGIFIRILMILSEFSDKNDKKSSRRSNSNEGSSASTSRR